PAALVLAPSRSSSTMTLAPDIGSPRSEVIFPRTTASCAQAALALANDKASALNATKSTPRQLWTIQSTSRERGIRRLWAGEDEATSRMRSRLTKAEVLERTSATIMTPGCQVTA